jgi:hypothetical protein
MGDVDLELVCCKQLQILSLRVAMIIPIYSIVATIMLIQPAYAYFFEAVAVLCEVCVLVLLFQAACCCLFNGVSLVRNIWIFGGVPVDSAGLFIRDMRSIATSH